jgi:hypothetical protein
MIPELARYYSLAIGIAGMLATLVRVSYLLGKILEAFRKHVSDSTAAHADYEARIRSLERSRHR